VTFDRPAAGAYDLHLRIQSNDAVEPEQTLELQAKVTS